MSSLSNYAEVPATAGRKIVTSSLYLVGFAACTLLAARYADSQSRWAELLTAECGAALGILWVFTFSMGPANNERIRPLIYAGILADLVFNFLAAQMFHRLHLHESHVHFAYGNLPADVMMGLGNLGMLTAAIGVGLLVARGLQKPNYLLMACVVGGVTDIFNIFVGPGKNEINSKIFPYITFQWGITGYGGLSPLVGTGDFVFLALYFFGVRKFGLDDRKTLLAMILAVGLGFVSAIYFKTAIPALPFFAVALFLVHGRDLWRQFLETRARDLVLLDHAVPPISNP